MKKRKNIVDKIVGFFDKYPRQYYVFGFFLSFGAVILITIFSYTFLNQEFYKKLADNQQLGEFVLPVNRGTVYFGNTGKSVFGTSVNLNDLAIDPQVVGDKKKLENFLVDIVYDQICHFKEYQNCYNGILKFLKVLEISDFRKEESYIKKLIRKNISLRMAKRKIQSVLLYSEVDDATVGLLQEKKYAGVYPQDGKVYINPEEIRDHDEMSATFVELFGGDMVKVKRSLRSRDIRYIPILNKISISVSEKIQDFLKEEKEAVKLGVLDPKNTVSNFIILTSNPSRYYPENSIGSQVIGFMDSSGKGHYGIEGFFNNILQGNDGQIISRKDVHGRIIDPISIDKEQLDSSGVNIYTTIDRNIQKKVESVIEGGVKRYRANAGSIVVMDPQTGNILAMANYPKFNANYSGDVYEIEKFRYSDYDEPEIEILGKDLLVVDKENGTPFIYDGKKIFLRKATRQERENPVIAKYKYKNDFGLGVYKNNVISGLYEPGSIMKAVTVAIGLETGEIKRYDRYQDNGKLVIDNFPITNVSDKCLGFQTFGNALNFSCNVGMVRVVQRIGRTLFHDYLKSFGFGSLTEVSLSGEVTSEVNVAQSRAQLFTSSYGLGISVTPIQMAAAYSVLANGGIYIKPKIIDAIEFPDGKTIEYKTEKIRRVIQESTSKVITSMLVDGVNNGAAKNAFSEGYLIAGKTGTAQIAQFGTYEVGVGSTNASFAGYAPAQDPKFVIIVRLNRPRTNNYGGQTSAFLFKETTEYLLDYYGIPKKEER